MILQHIRATTTVIESAVARPASSHFIGEAESTGGVKGQTEKQSDE